MSTFNAGAIEATLTLGRSSWTRDLRKTKKEIEDLEKTSITVGVDADTDNALIALDNLERDLDYIDDKTYRPSVDLLIHEAEQALERLEARLDLLDRRTVVIGADADIDNALVQLNNLELEMDMLENDTVKIEANADVSGAMAQLEELATFAKAVSAETVNIDADVEAAGAMAHLAELEAAAKLLDHETIEIDVDVDRSALASLVGEGASGGGGGGSLGLLKLLLMALLILSPAVAAATGSLTAAIVAMSAALVGAAGPALVLAGGLALLIKQFKDAKDNEMTPAMRDMADALQGVKDALDVVRDGIGDAGFELMADALDLFALILPTLVPLFNATAGAIDGVLEEIKNFVKSSEYDDMLAFFGGFGVDMLVSFIHILGNVIQFFGRLFQAIEPFAREMMKGLEDVTAGWAQWADDLETNKSFQTFVDNAREYGPRLLDMLGSLIQAFIAIGRALEPFAGPMIEGLTRFFDLIANMPQEQLTFLIGAGAALWGTFHILIPLFSALSTGVEVLTAAIGLPLLPILAIAAALGIVAFALYEAWQKNEQFRDIVTDAWNEIIDTVKPIVEDIVGLIRDNWGAIKDWAEEVWGSIESIITDWAIVIIQVVRGALAVIRFIWDHFGSWIIDFIRGVFTILGGVIKGGLQIVSGIFKIFRGIFTGDWGAIKEGIMSIVHGFITVLTGVWNGIKTILQRPFSNIKDWVAARIGDVIAFFRTVGSKIGSATAGMFDGIKNAFRSAINWIIRAWNNLSFTLPGIDPPGPGPKIPSVTFGTPNIPELAFGAAVTDPTLAWIGEGTEPEIVAPDSKMQAMADRAANGSRMDYNKLAAIMMAAVERVLAKFSGVTVEDMERLIESAGVDITATVGDGNGAVERLAAALGFELRRLGYGGKANV